MSLPKKNKSPKVSIIIPVFNGENYIEECLVSVKQQKYKNIEVIIVNDGSTDSSLEKITSLADERFKVYTIKNSGQAAATNFALKKIKGDYIQFLDCDDILDEYKIFNQIESINREKISVSDLCISRFEDFSKIGSVDHTDRPIYEINDNVKMLQFCLKHYMISNSSPLIHKSLAKIVGGYSDRLTVDNNYDYFSRLLSKINRIYFVGNSVSYNRFVPGSLSRQSTVESIQSSLDARMGSCKILLSLDDSIDSKIASGKCMLDFLLKFKRIKKPIEAKAYSFIQSNRLIFDSSLIPKSKLKLISRIFGLKNAIFLYKTIR